MPQHQQLIIIAAWAVAGIACSLPHNAILSGISIFASSFPSHYFAHVVCAVYLPSLVASLVSHVLNGTPHNTTSIVKRRVAWVTICTCPIMIMLYMPDLLHSTSSTTFLELGTVIVGFCSFCVYNTLQQLAAYYSNITKPASPHDESHRRHVLAAFAFGYQFSGGIIFLLAQATHFDAHADMYAKQYFYRGIALMQLVCIVTGTWLVEQSTTASNPVSPKLPITTSPPMSPLAQQQSSSIVPENSNNNLLLSAIVSLFVTVFASVAALPLYAEFATISHPNRPQHLFFVRLFSDAFSRIFTVLPTCMNVATTPNMLLVLAFARIWLIVPLLLIRNSGREEELVMGLFFTVAVFSFGSGFLVTRAFQLGTSSLGGGNNNNDPSWLLTTTFSCALSSASLFVVMIASE